MRIHFKKLQRLLSGRPIDLSRAAHLCKVANASQQAIRNTRRAPRTHRDLSRSIFIYRNIQNLGRAFHDKTQIIIRVKLKSKENPKSRTQRRRKETGPRRSSDKGKRLDVHHVRSRRRTLSDDDVQLVVFEGGVEFFFQNRLQSMDLVKKQDLALSQIRQNCSQVSLNL